MQQQKTIFITGTSSGLGLSMANALAADGHRVYGTSRHTNFSTDHVFTSIQMDVTDDQSVKDAVTQVISREAKIDVLINNAGITLSGSLCNMPSVAAQQQFDVNVFGVMRCCSAVLPLMLKNNSGLIINIGSLAGLFGLPYQGLYSASKFAIEGYTQSLRMELKNTAVNVTLLNPGDFKTNITLNRKKIVTALPIASMQKEYESAIRTMEKDETEGADPAILARQICRIVNTTSPATRYLSGSALQRTTPLLKRILPARLFESLIAAHYGIR